MPSAPVDGTHNPTRKPIIRETDRQTLLPPTADPHSHCGFVKRETLAANLAEDVRTIESNAVLLFKPPVE